MNRILALRSLLFYSQFSCLTEQRKVKYLQWKHWKEQYRPFQAGGDEMWDANSLFKM